MAVNIS